ncbi:MAG: right-handed parallel beta-helix repeat-containing protein [Nannocystaceae bacterium]
MATRSAGSLLPLLLAASALALGVAATARAEIYEVSPGDDFCAVFNGQAAPGDHVVLLPGTHPGPCNLSSGGVEGQPKVLRAADPDQPTAIVYDGNGSNVLDVNASDVTVAGLRFGPTNPGIDAIKIKAGDRTVVQGNHFVQIGGIAVSANTTTTRGLAILDNHFEDLQATGIYLGCHDGVGACAAENFVVAGNLIDGVDSANVGYGLEVKLDSFGIVRDNVIHDTKGPGIEIFGATDLGKRNLVDGNLVIGSRNNGTLEVAGGPTTVRSNVVIGGSYAGIYVYDYQDRDLVRDIQIVGNTVIGDAGPAIRLSEWAADKALELVGNAAWQEAGMGPAIPAAIDGVSWAGNVDCADPSACWVDGAGRDLWPVADGPLLAMGAAPTLAELAEDFCLSPRGDVPHVGALERIADVGPGALAVGFKAEIACPEGDTDGTTGGDTTGTSGGDTDGTTAGTTAATTDASGTSTGGESETGAATTAATTGDSGTTATTATSATSATSSSAGGEGDAEGCACRSDDRRGAPLGLVALVLVGLRRRRA